MKRISETCFVQGCLCIFPLRVYCASCLQDGVCTFGHLLKPGVLSACSGKGCNYNLLSILKCLLSPPGRSYYSTCFSPSVSSVQHQDKITQWSWEKVVHFLQLLSFGLILVVSGNLLQGHTCDLFALTKVYGPEVLAHCLVRLASLCVGGFMLTLVNL